MGATLPKKPRKTPRLEDLPEQVRNVVLDEVLKASVRARTAIKVDDVLADDRARRLAVVRWAIWWRLNRTMRTVSNRAYSYDRLGFMFGRDHTTIMHGVKKYDAARTGLDVAPQALVDIAEVANAMYANSRRDWIMANPPRRAA